MRLIKCSEHNASFENEILARKFFTKVLFARGGGFYFNNQIGKDGVAPGEMFLKIVLMIICVTIR